MNLNQTALFFKIGGSRALYKSSRRIKNLLHQALSHAIGSLEKELGTRLFKKHGRGVVLTKYGKLFKEYVDNARYSLDTGVKR